MLWSVLGLDPLTFLSYSPLSRPAELHEVRGADFVRCSGGERAWKRIVSRAKREDGAVLPPFVWPRPTPGSRSQL